MSNDNLRLWKQVEETPTAITKLNPATDRLSINAMFQKEKATEMFGIYGQDWGITYGTENYERNKCESVTLLTYTAQMYFNFDNKIGIIPIAASIKEVYVSSKGKFIVDEDAIKKVRTDALTKGLSELGFNADVYKGFHEFTNYGEYVDGKAIEEDTSKKEDKAVKEAEEYADWKPKALEEFALVKTIKAVETLRTKFTRKGMAMGDNVFIKELNLSADARIEEIREESAAKKKAKEDEAKQGKEENQTDIEEVINDNQGN